MIKLKHKFRDIILNVFRVFKAYIHLKKYKGENRSVSPPSDYKTIFEDKFENDSINTNVWRYGQIWGDFHPNEPYQYYDDRGDLAHVSSEGLVLELRNKPKTYIKSQLPEWRRTPEMPEVLTIQTGVGMLSTKEAWQYGWFEAWIKLPKGQSYLPAFWLTGLNSWPPEIDILEAPSTKGPEYEGNFLFWKIKNKKIQPNLHYGKMESGTLGMYGAYDVPVADCTKRFVQYVCHWESNFIRIYYDGIMIFETTDKKILKWYNGERDQMFVVLNHAKSKKNPPDRLPDESDMIVKSFRVCQK